jgi:hypothetical protein
VSSGWYDRGLRISIKGISRTAAPRLLRPDDRALA